MPVVACGGPERVRLKMPKLSRSSFRRRSTRSATVASSIPPDGEWSFPV